MSAVAQRCAGIMLCQDAGEACLSNFLHDIRGSVQEHIAAGNAVLQQVAKKSTAFQLGSGIHDNHSEPLALLHMTDIFTQRMSVSMAAAAAADC